MLAVALALLVGAGLEEPSPPPLVPFDPAPPASPLDVPPTPPPLAPADVAPELEPREPEAGDVSVRVPDDAVPFSGTRALVVGTVAAGTGALLVGGALALLGTRDSNATLLLLLSIPTSLFAGTALGYLVHRRMGGLGSYGSHLGGGAIGGGLGLLATYLIVLTQNRFDVTASIASVFTMSALFGLGTALFAELSNFRTLRENGFGVSLVPVHGGAVAAAGFRF